MIDEDEVKDRRIHNVQLTDIVGITVRLPDGKQKLQVERAVREITAELREADPSPDRIGEMVDELAGFDATKPCVDALRESLKTKQAVLQMCLAIGRVWGDQDPTKPQVSVKSNPTASVSRKSPEEAEAWETILNS